MKRLLFFLCLLLTSALPTSAHVAAPLPWYLGKTDEVCLAKVTSFEGNKITFSVTEVLHGQPAPVFNLLAYSGDNYPVNSEWLLVSCPGGFKDCVGWATKGDCEWIPNAVIRDGSNVYVKDWEFGKPDGPKGYSLDQVKQFLKVNPPKP